MSRALRASARLRPSPALAVSVVAFAIAAGGVAWAAIPDGQGVIHSCYSKASGSMRVIDSTARCSALENTLTFSQQGPVGPAGKDGSQGIQGVPGKDGTNGKDGGTGPAGSPTPPRVVVGEGVGLWSEATGTGTRSTQNTIEVSLPAGKWSIHVSGDFHNQDTDDQGWSCSVSGVSSTSGPTSWTGDSIPSESYQHDEVDFVTDSATAARTLKVDCNGFIGEIDTDLLAIEAS